MRKAMRILFLGIVFSAWLSVPLFGADEKWQLPESLLLYDLYYNYSTITFNPTGAASFTAPTPFVSFDFGWIMPDAFISFDMDAFVRFIIGSLTQQPSGSDRYIASDKIHKVFYARNLRCRGSLSMTDLGPGFLGLALNIADFHGTFAYIPTTAVHDLVMGGLGFGAGPSYLFTVGSMFASHTSVTYNLAFDFSTQKDNPLIPDTYAMIEEDLWFFPVTMFGIHAYVGYEMHFFRKRTNNDYPCIYDGTGSILSVRLGGTLAIPID